jgi:uncharacterized repeat protein (TIGR03803 family)
MHKNVSTNVANFLALAAVTLIFTAACLAQATERILYSFTAGIDGGYPYAGMVMDAKGNLYGTTSQGGANFAGAVFEVTPNSNGTWTEQVLYSFAGFNGTGDGYLPYSTLTFDAKGNLYSTTQGGGASFHGTVFQLSPQSNGTWSEKVLYSFGGGNDGAEPFAGVILDTAGNLYGTTFSGGKYGFGTAFELEAGANGTWTEKQLHNFTGAVDGANPFYGSLAFDRAGNLYGETYSGGANDYGVIYQLSLASNGEWTEKIVHAFSGGSDGDSTAGNLVVDNHGNVFAESFFSVQELTPTNGVWTTTNIHNFTGGSDGSSAEGGLFLDKAGNVYGMTFSGGAHRGTVFELTPSSNGTWTEKILHRFTGGTDGDFPQLAPVTVDGSGNVYGTTPAGGGSNAGVVFEVKP